MNRNQATIISKLDIIACNIIFVIETKDMYGSGNVSTHNSTKITPKTSNTYQSAKTTTFTNLRTFKAASPIYILLSKVQTPCLIIIYDIPSMFLSSSPDHGGRQLQEPRAGEVYLVV